MTQFFVNRGGGRVPEGPFEESQIITLIRAGKLRAGYVCEVGRQRFTLLSSHPSFAQALAEAAEPEAAGLAGKVTSARVPARPATRKPVNRFLLLGAVVAFFGLVLVIGATGAYILFNNGGMPARGAVPSDTELFVEVANVRRLVTDLGGVRVLDTSKLQAQELMSNAVADLSTSFGVSSAGAETLLLAASSLGVAERSHGGVSEGGLVLTFSSAAPVNSFLRSKRFTYTGLVATNGRKYKLAAGVLGSDANASTALRALTGLELDAPPPVLVWFETSKVLFLGSVGFAEGVANVVSLSAPSIERSPGFQSALRDFSDKPNVIAYFDSSKLAELGDPRAKSIVVGYFKSAGPATASLRFAPAGVITHLVARFSGEQLTSRPPPAAPQALTISERLPVETFAYVAAVTKSGLSGADMQKLLLEQLAKSDARTAEQLRAGIAGLEQRLHLHLDQVLGSVGDQGALALLAPDDYRIALAAPEQMLANFAVVYAQALSDEAPARALLKALKADLGSLGSKAKIIEDSDGYRITPNDDRLGVSAELRFLNGYLYFALGNSGLLARSWRAFSAGERTLATDPAYGAARAALPNAAQIFLWVDAGRTVDALLKNPLLAAQASSLGADNSVIRWSGPDRVTLALSVAVEAQNGSYTYRVDSLNLPVLVGFSGALSAFTPGAASPLLPHFP